MIRRKYWNYSWGDRLKLFYSDEEKFRADMSEFCRRRQWVKFVFLYLLVMAFLWQLKLYLYLVLYFWFCWLIKSNPISYKFAYCFCFVWDIVALRSILGIWSANVCLLYVLSELHTVISGGWINGSNSGLNCIFSTCLCWPCLRAGGFIVKNIVVHCRQYINTRWESINECIKAMIQVSREL